MKVDNMSVDKNRSSDKINVDNPANLDVNHNVH